MKTDSIYNIHNPVDEYRTEGFTQQRQPYPGLQRDMDPVPDSGEMSYKGTGRLQGRKALITGGDSGIGRSVAIAYAREGADVAINYLPSEEADAHDLKTLLEGEGRKITLIPGNLADEHFCIKLVDRAYDAMKGLDILALVAGRQIARKSIEEITTDQLEEVFAVNVYSLFWVIKQALPLLPEGSSIITTSSIQAFDPSATLLDYASTKGAIKAFTQSLAKQLASRGIRVNTVAPGPIWTPLQVSGGQPTEALPKFGQDTPLQRSGQPAELAGIYVFLASQESSYVTAQFFGVTGGKTLA